MIDAVLFVGLNLVLLLACWCWAWDQQWSVADRALAGSVAFTWLVVAVEVLLAATGLLRRDVLYSIVLLLALATLWRQRAQIRHVVGDSLQSVKGTWQRVDWWGRVAALVVIAFGMWTALNIWWLPTIDWDGQWYHLPIAFSRIQSGNLSQIPSYWPHFITGYPEAGELLIFWVSAWLRQAWLSDGAQFMFWGLGVLAIYSLGRKLGLARAACLWAGAVWAGTPIVFLQAKTAHVDLAIASLFLIGLNFVLLRDSSCKATAVIAALAGLIAGLKYGGLVYSGVLGLLWIGLIGLPLLRQASMRRMLGAVAVLLAVSAVGWIWYAANGFRFGNPLWPLDVSLGPIHWEGPLSMEWQQSNMHTPAEIMGLPWWRQLVPIWLELDNHYFYAAARNGFGPQWWMLGLPGIAFWLFYQRSKDAWLLFLATVSILALAPWSWHTRYVMFLPAIGGLGLASVLTHGRRPVRILAHLLLLVSFLYTTFLAFDSPTGIGVIWPQASLPAEWRRSTLLPPMEGAFRWLDQNSRRPAEIGYGDNLGLIGMLWGEDLRHQVLYVTPEEMDEVDTVVAVLDSPQDRVARQDSRFVPLVEDATGVRTLRVRIYRYVVGKR